MSWTWLYELAPRLTAVRSSSRGSLSSSTVIRRKPGRTSREVSPSSRSKCPSRRCAACGSPARVATSNQSSKISLETSHGALASSQSFGASNWTRRTRSGRFSSAEAMARATGSRSLSGPSRSKRTRFEKPSRRFMLMYRPTRGSDSLMNDEKPKFTGTLAAGAASNIGRTTPRTRTSRGRLVTARARTESSLLIGRAA